MGATVLWQCSACGKTFRSPYRPGDKAGGKCLVTSSGNHMWQQG